MLHNRRDRRVATDGSATVGRRYHVALLLLLCLSASPDTTVAVAAAKEQSGRVLRSFFGAVGVGSGDEVGAERRPAASGSRHDARTASNATFSRRNQGEFSVSRITTAASVSPITDAWARERCRRVLLATRGGSEGLKSKAWVREKAAAGLAAKGVDGKTVDEAGATHGGPAAKMGPGAGAGPTIAPPSATSPRDDAKKPPSVRNTGADGQRSLAEGLGGSSGSSPEPRIGTGTHGDETPTSPEGAKRVGGETSGVKGVSGERLESQDDSRWTGDLAKRAGIEEGASSGASPGGFQAEDGKGAALDVYIDRPTAISSVDGGAAAAPAAGWAARDTGVARDSLEGKEEVPIARPGSAGAAALIGEGRPGESAADNAGSAAGSSRDRPASSVETPGADGDACGSTGVEETRSAFDAAPPSSGDTATATTSTNPDGEASYGSGRRSTPRADYHNNPYLPRAGAPPPPRGEVRVRRPWGRHGAAPPPGFSSSDGVVPSDSRGTVLGVQGAAHQPGASTPASHPSGDGVARGDGGGEGRGVGGSTPGWADGAAAGSEQ
ncbi:unnamed protein product, partial [Scytosiphon promiscuus]